MASAPTLTQSPLTNVEPKRWTAADLLDRLGPIRLDRIINPPEVGTATVDDVVRLHVQQNRLCELIDGMLVEKAMEFFESVLAGALIEALRQFVYPRGLGQVAGEGGMLELLPNQVRIPDVCFVSKARLAAIQFQQIPVPEVAPDLAVEILSESNTRREMEQKLLDYFTSGVRLVWYIDPPTQIVRVYTSPDQVIELGRNDKLTGGDVLPGFELSLDSYFRQS
jgi:Uma2 family endonuclease